KGEEAHDDQPSHAKQASRECHDQALPARATRMPGVGLCFPPMCRNIRPLFNFEPPATDDEIQAAALQYVRKVSGTRKPSVANVDPFERAVAEIAEATRRLVDSLETTSPPKNREVEAAKARERSAHRYNS